jgi:hypothetical protein
MKSFLKKPEISSSTNVTAVAVTPSEVNKELITEISPEAMDETPPPPTVNDKELIFAKAPAGIKARKYRHASVSSEPVAKKARPAAGGIRKLAKKYPALDRF